MPKFVFDTSQMPSHLRREDLARLWCETLSASAIKVEANCPKPDAFFARCETLVLGESVITRAVANSIVLHRRRRHIAQDGQDKLMLLVNAGSGAIGGTQFGAETMLAPGEAALFDCAHEHITHSVEGSRALGLYVDRHSFEACGVDIAGVAARRLDPSMPAARILVDYLGSLMERGDEGSSPLAALSDRHVRDLLLLAVGVGGNARREAEDGGLAQVRLLELRKALRRRACERNLTADDLGAELGVSGRTAQLAFTRANTTFSQELTAARLEAARACLTDPACAATRMIDIAYEAGFRDLSTFYRAFRERYGLAPGEAREAALRDRS